MHPDRQEQAFGNFDRLHRGGSPTMRSRRKRRRIHTSVSRSPTPEQPKKKKKVDIYIVFYNSVKRTTTDTKFLVKKNQ